MNKEEDELMEGFKKKFDELFETIDSDDDDSDLDDLFDDILSDEKDNIVVLNDEDGNDVRFEFLDFIEYKGKDYVVLLPADEIDADEVVILQADKTDGDEEEYTSVEDEQTLNIIFEMFKEKFKDIFDFVD